MQILLGGEIPVFDKNALKCSNGRSLQAQVGIPPETKARHFAEIFVSNVQTARKGHAAVHYCDLAVVAHVDLKAATQEIDRQKLAALAARFNSAVESFCSAGSWHRTTTALSPSRAFCTSVNHLPAQVVRLKDEVFVVNMVTGATAWNIASKAGYLVVEIDLVARRHRKATNNFAMPSQVDPVQRLSAVPQWRHGAAG